MTQQSKGEGRQSKHVFPALYEQQEPRAAKNKNEPYKLSVKKSRNQKLQPIKQQKGCRPIAQK
jgi:hypothetical protein